MTDPGYTPLTADQLVAAFMQVVNIILQAVYEHPILIGFFIVASLAGKAIGSNGMKKKIYKEESRNDWLMEGHEDDA